MRNSRRQGAVFEDLACAYLRRNGYRIVGRNVYVLRKELDVIAMDGDTVVFVEVKGRRSGAYGSPAESVGFRKRTHMIRVAEAYMGRAGLWGRPCRFDVVSIKVDPGGNTTVEHLKDAFGLTG